MVSHFYITIVIFVSTLSILNALFNIDFSAVYPSPDKTTQDSERIWFDIPNKQLKKNTKVAKLMLYHKSNFSGQIISDKPYTVKVYRVERDDTGKEKLDFMKSKNVSTKKEGWISIGIKSAIRYWRRHPDKNFGLALKVEHSDRPSVLTPDEAGFMNIKQFNFRPHIVLFQT